MHFEVYAALAAGIKLLIEVPMRRLTMEYDPKNAITRDPRDQRVA